MSLIHESGFPPSVFRLEEVDETNSGAPLGVFSEEEEQRYLLLSNSEYALDHHPNHKRRRRTKNGKTVSKSMTIIHDGVEYQINNAPTYGVYLEIFHRFMDQLIICRAKWKRVFVIRFDLHQKFHTLNNAMISKFRDNLVRRIARRYELFEVGYVWVREQERSTRQHYHFALFIDGDKVKHSSAISKMIRETWERLKDGNFVHIPKCCYYNLVVGDGEAMAEVVWRLSYLAKQRGKGYRPPQTKDYSTSRLLKPNRYSFT